MGGTGSWLSDLSKEGIGTGYTRVASSEKMGRKVPVFRFHRAVKRYSRRDWIQGLLAGGAVLGMDSAPPPWCLAADASDGNASPPDRARHVASLVQWLRTTPREQIIRDAQNRVTEGVEYRDLLAALLTAGAWEIQPRPSVGFKFHAVLAVISYHLIGSQLNDGDRWLPLLWGIDYFKSAQAQDAAEGDWMLGELNASRVPSVDDASEMLVRAMERWDEAAADVAAAAVARHTDPASVFDVFFALGARDFRSIGHKAIYVMCARRTLDVVGWEFAEPVLRSLAYALLMHEDGNPANREDEADRPWRRNQQIVGKVRETWNEGAPNAEAVAELLTVLHSGSNDDAVDAIVTMLNRGVAPASIWDSLFCGAAELQLRSPNIVSLHAVTTTRAVHDAYRVAREPRTKLLLMLQNAAFLPMFRDGARNRGEMSDNTIARLQAFSPKGPAPRTVADCVADLGGQRQRAAERILGYLQSEHPVEPLRQRLYELAALKGNDAHDFKFTSAALECFDYISPEWRNRYLSCGAMHFCGPDQRDNRVVQRMRTT